MSDPLAPLLNQIENNQASEARSLDEQKRLIREGEARAALGRLHRLSENEDLKWFFATYFKPLVDREDADCRNPLKAGLLGPIAANRYQIAHKMLTMLDAESRVAEHAASQIISRR